MTKDLGLFERTFLIVGRVAEINLDYTLDSSRISDLVLLDRDIEISPKEDLWWRINVFGYLFKGCLLKHVSRNNYNLKWKSSYFYCQIPFLLRWIPKNLWIFAKKNYFWMIFEELRLPIRLYLNTVKFNRKYLGIKQLIVFYFGVFLRKFI